MIDNAILDRLEPPRRQHKSSESHPVRLSKPSARGFKLVVEIAGTGLESFCGERITSAAVRHNPLHTIDPPRCRTLINEGQDKHRSEVVIAGITRTRRHVYLDPGCCDTADAACPIPLQRAARPVDLPSQAVSWPTVLIPLVPLACADPWQSAHSAEPLRNGWLYVYVNGHLWRELYASGDQTFRDVNLALPTQAGSDAREPTGRAVSSIIVPRTIDGEPQRVALALSEVQWSWHTVCAMGGPAEDDPRFTPQMIARARQIPVDVRRRDRRFTVLDLSGYPGRFDTPDGRLRDIADAPCRPINGTDPLRRYRGHRIAAVYLPDPLLVARRLAGQYQQAWRAMEALLKSLVLAPKVCVQQRRYDPGRWFDSALPAAQFFFSPFPGYRQWRRLHPKADRRQWRHARQQRDRMAARLDKAAIEEALGAEKRRELRAVIERTKADLVAYLSARTRDPLDLLVLMIDDYFLLPNPCRRQDPGGISTFGYLDGWSVVEQLIARLADHSHTLDIGLETRTPDTARLTCKDPGAALLFAIADPVQNHPLHSRLFPASGPDGWTPNLTPADPHAAIFKPQQFQNADTAGMHPVSAFATHFAKAALATKSTAVRQSLVRLANAAFGLGMIAETSELRDAVRHAARQAPSPDEARRLIERSLQGTLQPHQMADLMRPWTVLINVGMDRDGYRQADGDRTTDEELLQGCCIERRLSSRSTLVKNPLPGVEKGVITFPEPEASAGLRVMDPMGTPVGTLSIADLRHGRIAYGHWDEHRQAVYRTGIRIDLLVSRDPGLLDRFRHPTNQHHWDPNAVATILAMFEAWNVCRAIQATRDQLNDEDQFRVWMDQAGSLVDLSVLDAFLIHARTAARAAGRPDARDASGGPILRHPSSEDGDAFPCLLGADADAWSAYPSGREMIACSLRHPDAAPGQSGWHWSSDSGVLSFAAWRHALFAQGSASPPLTDISSDAVSWISPARVLAGLVPLVDRFDDDSPLAEWLAHGPFAKDAAKNATKNAKDLPEGIETSTSRFAGHRPGNVHWGPPVGGNRNMLKYPGSCKVMEFWKEPDGSFLWIDAQGTIVDWHIKDGGRLELRDGRLYLRLPGEKVRLGGMFQQIQNRHRLLVDRKETGDRFRAWCERPETACASLAGALFAPQIDVRLTKTKTLQHPCTYRERTFHAANPLEGFIHTAHIRVALPHFVPDRSRLYIEMWHQGGQGPDTLPRLTYADNIVLEIDPRRPLRQFTLHWPLAWETAQREIWITIRCRLDLEGDGATGLPLNPNGMPGGPEDWTMVSLLVNRETMTEQRF
ncbi:hypothetical protein [Desulfatitalea tepidiphila]|uniref:hypothetical protein n=1 Tax=Desulfatitalea tepidiphila TaxID=1185843 RepID=UPI0006B551B0|nr:hypothetical protein [Desulfatitalea tepidiphila]